MDDESYTHLFPVAIEVEQGKTYHWCGCGQSNNQPLCDRENCGDKSVPYLATLTEDVYFCNCKQTKNPPLCDGSHGKALIDMLKNRKRNSHD